MGLPAKELTLLGSRGSNPLISAHEKACAEFLRSFFSNNTAISVFPRGVIGNTSVFGADILGSNPSEEATKLL